MKLTKFIFIGIVCWLAILHGHGCPKPPPPPAPSPPPPPAPAPVAPSASGFSLWIRSSTEIGYNKDLNSGPPSNAYQDLVAHDTGMSSSILKYINPNFGVNQVNAMTWAVPNKYTRVTVSFTDRNGVGDTPGFASVSSVDVYYKVDGGSTVGPNTAVASGLAYFYDILVPSTITTDVEVWAIVTFTDQSTKTLDNNGNGNYWLPVLAASSSTIGFAYGSPLPSPTVTPSGSVVDDGRTVTVSYSADRFWQLSCNPGGAGAPFIALGTMTIKNSSGVTKFQWKFSEYSDISNVFKTKLFSGLDLTDIDFTFDGCTTSYGYTDPTSGVYTISIA